MFRRRKDMEVLALVVHVSLAVLHVLGATYNIMHRRWSDVAIHAAGAVYDSTSAAKHARQLQ